MKSELFNTIIPGRLYPTRTSHGKILELRICKSPCSNTASVGLDDSKNFNSLKCSDLKSASDRHNYNDSVMDYQATARKKNEDEHAKYMKRYQLNSSSENVKGNRYGESGASIRSDRTYDGMNNNNNSCSYNSINSNNTSSRNRGSVSDICGNSNKTTHKVLARSGSLIQEVSIVEVTTKR